MCDEKFSYQFLQAVLSQLTNVAMTLKLVLTIQEIWDLDVFDKIFDIPDLVVIKNIRTITWLSHPLAFEVHNIPRVAYLELKCLRNISVSDYFTREGPESEPLRMNFGPEKSNAENFWVAHLETKFLPPAGPVADSSCRSGRESDPSEEISDQKRPTREVLFFKVAGSSICSQNFHWVGPEPGSP